MAYPTLVIGPSGTGSGTTITVPNPGVQPGELVIVGMMNNSNTAVSGLPAGWNVGGSNAASSSYDRFTVVWARAESATWPLTATIAATRDFVYQPIRVQNWDSAVDPQFLLNNRGASGTTVSFGSITPTGGASDAIDIVFLGRNNPTLGAATAPTDYTSFIDVTQGTTAAGTALQVASYNSNLNPTGTKTATSADSSIFYNTGHIVVKGGTASPGTVYQVSGASVASSMAAGSITSLASVSGVVAVASTTSGALVGVGSLAGTVVATSATFGSASAVGGLSGTSAAVSSAAGAITSRTGTTGTSSATSATSGALSGSVSATTVPKQSEMPAAPFDLYPAPSMSWMAGSAPSGAGYASVAPDNQAVRLLGHARKGVQAGSVSGFVNPAPLQDIAGAGTGTNPLVYPPFGIRILTNSPEVWFRLGQRSYAGFSNVSSRAAVRIRVNGKWISLMPVYVGSTIGFPSNPENITAGEYALKLAFPDSQNREIELNTHLEFGGVVIPSAYSALTPRQVEHVAVFLDGSLGGSEKHQTGNFSLSGADGSGSAATYTAVTSYEWALGQVLAYDSIVNSAAGSSGFSISGDTASWKSTSKVPKDVIEHLGDLNVIGSANNDDVAGQTPAQVDVAANTVYGNVATACKPGALNVAMGMFTAPALGSQATVEARVAPYNDVLKARAQQWGFWFVNPTTGQTFDPQGNLRRTTSNWVYQDTSDISSDNTHPTQRGANNLGVKFADAIRMAHEASAPQAMSGAVAVTSAVKSPSTGTPPDVSNAFAGQTLQTRGASWVEFGSYGSPAFPDLLPAALGFSSIFNRGRAGRRAQNNSALMVAAGDYAFDTAFNGPVLIHEPGNNLIEDDTPANRAAALQAVRAMVAVSSASSRVEQSSFTFSNNSFGESWNAESSQPYASGGALRIGVYGGLTATIPVQAGDAYLLVHGTDASVAPGMDFRVTQNGVEIAYQSSNGTTLQVPGYPAENGDADKANVGVSPLVIRLSSLSAGTVTLETDRAGRDGALAFVDAIFPQSKTPRTIFLVKPTTLNAPSHNKPALLAYLRSVIDTVAAEFGDHVIVVDPQPGWDPATMLGEDGLHPNSLGTAHVRDAVVSAVQARAQRDMPGSLTVSVATAGAAAVLSAATGSVAKASSASGAVNAVSATTGTIAGAAGLSGTVAALSATSGSTARMAPLSGQSNAISNAVGQITATLPTAAAAEAMSTASGALNSRTQAAGAVDAVSGTTGSTSPTGSLVGTVAAQSATSGQVLQRAVVAGQVVAVATTTGNPIVVSGLSGSVSAASGSSGAINLQAQALGVVAAISTISGALVPAAGTGGAVGATSAAVGAAKLLAQLSGGANATSAAIAAVVILRSVAGMASASSSTSGSIVNSGIIPMPDILEFESITPTLTLVALQERAQ